MSTAARTAGWSRRWGRTGVLANPPGPMNPAGSVPALAAGTDPIGLKVEIYLGGTGWEDITPYVYYRDRVQISRGQSDEASSLQPQTCSLTLNNRDGRFSSRNPTGPYYGLLSRNTPLRVSRLQNGERRYRFYGEVSSWPVQWDISGTDVYDQITAAGPLRRLTQGTQDARSAARRAFTTNNVAFAFADAPAKLAAYWPCEDESGSMTIAPDGPTPSFPMLIRGTPDFAANSNFACSEPIPTFNSSVWTGRVQSTSDTWTAQQARFLMQVPSGGDTNSARICSVYSSGPNRRWDLIYTTAGSGTLTFKGYDLNGIQVWDSGGFFTTAVNGGTYRVSLELTSSQYQLQLISLGATNAITNVFGGVTATIGPITQVIFNPDATLVGTAVGHISVQRATSDISDLNAPFNAFVNEDTGASGALRRVERLCGEELINYTQDLAVSYTSPAGTVVTMGAQAADTLVNLIQQVVDTDLSLVFEARDYLGLRARYRATLYNQPISLTLDYAQNQLAAALAPVDDDQYLRNDVTVQRTGGSSSRQILSQGRLSALAPPNGIGRYSTSYDLNLYSTADIGSGSVASVADHAGWRLLLGTVDEARYPQVSLNLRHAAFTSLDMLNAALGVDIGDRIAIQHPPAWMPPDDIALRVAGYSESLGVYEHDMTFNCVPVSPWTVLVLDDSTHDRLDTDGSTLSTAVDSVSTTLSVARTNSGSPLWTTSASEAPFDIAVGGERMTVTVVSGAASPQTFTVTRSVNGVVKSHTAGEDVRLWQPSILSL